MGFQATRPYNGCMSKKSDKAGNGTIALNRRAKFDYHIEDRFEAGLMLEGWEVKSLRAGKAQLVDSYVLIKDGEAFLLGAQIAPLQNASAHEVPDPKRTRKLLLHKDEIGRIFRATSAKGYTCVATALFWKGPIAKCEIGLAKGKKQHDKRQDDKEKDWAREKERMLKHSA